MYESVLQSALSLPLEQKKSLMGALRGEVTRNALAPFRGGAGPSVEIGEKYLNESFAGDRDGAGAGMPREPHRNGGSVHARGLSKLKACVVTLVNDPGDSACEVVGRGKPSKGRSPAAWRAPPSRARRSRPTR